LRARKRKTHIKSEIIGKGGTLLPFLVFIFPAILYIIPGIDCDIVFLYFCIFVIFQEYITV
jgi:hypothetical protein